MRKKTQERQSFLDELWTAHSLGDEQQEPLSMRLWEKNKQANSLRESACTYNGWKRTSVHVLMRVDQLPRLVRVPPQPNPVLTYWKRVHADPPAGPRYSRQSRRSYQRSYILVMRCRSRGWLVPVRCWGRGWLIAVRGRSTRRLVAIAVPRLEARNIGHQAGF